MDAKSELAAPDLHGQPGPAVDGPQLAGKEIELKLVGKPAALRAIFKQLPGAASRPAKLVSTYYDTQDLRLWNRGFTLRLRNKGEAFELTMKRDHGRALERGEWSAIVPDPTADLAQLPPSVPRGEIGLVLPEELAACFTTQITRTVKQVEIDGASIEVALDRGSITAGKRKELLIELEFELKGGSVPAMLAFARGAVSGGGATISSRAKSERGMDLVAGIRPQPVKAERPVLTRHDSVASALSAIVSGAVLQAIANIPAACEGEDIEGVHQLRVALRRLRSGFSLFKRDLTGKAKALESDAGDVLKVLGAARDLDVFLAETLPLVGQDHPDEVLEELAGAARKAQTQAYENLRRLIADPPFTQLIIDLLILAEEPRAGLKKGDQPLISTAAARLEKHHRHVLKRGRKFDRQSSAERHRVRLALKKLRYACDYLKGLYQNEPGRNYLKRLSVLQDDMGQFNDASVAERVAGELCAAEPQAAGAASLVQDWHHQRLEALEPHLVKAWARFAKARPFWRD